MSSSDPLDEYKEKNGDWSRIGSEKAGEHEAKKGWDPSPQRHDESRIDYDNRMRGYDNNKS